MDWDRLADDKALGKTVDALIARGFDVTVANNGEEARGMVLAMIPKGAEVLHLTSATLNDIGVTKHIEESGDYYSLGKRIREVSDGAEREKLRRITLSPQYGIGSVQAITEDGQVMAVSATGSQLPVYAYGAANVIWVVGIQKIVKNLDAAFRRVYEYALELESERVKRTYGIQRSSVNKILIFERERPGRIKIILVKQKLGF